MTFASFVFGPRYVRSGGRTSVVSVVVGERTIVPIERMSDLSRLVWDLGSVLSVLFCN